MLSTAEVILVIVADYHVIDMGDSQTRKVLDESLPTLGETIIKQQNFTQRREIASMAASVETVSKRVLLF